MSDLPAEFLNLGPTAGVLVVVWAFLRYLTQQRDASVAEAREERAEFRAALDRMIASNERVAEGISGRVERLAEAQIALTKAIESVAPSRNS